MRYPSFLCAALLLAACSSGGNIAENTAGPPDAISEQPGDWSGLVSTIGRTPADSGLLQQSPISVDLNALLGSDLARFRQAAETGSALVREGQVLVTIGGERTSYLVIVPSDHALAAGLKTPGGWKTWTTPGAEVPLPASVQALVQPSG